MIYLLIKTAHITSVITWMGVMIFVPAIIAALSSLPPDARLACAARVRTWYLTVGSISMIGTWIFGITLMTMGGWMPSGWMIAKITIVLVLSGLHGFLSGQFRRLATDRSFELSDWARIVTIGELFAVLVIVALVIIKPFS